MDNYETYAFIGASISQGYFDETGGGWVRRLFEKLNQDKPLNYYYSLHSRAGDRCYDHYYRLCGEAIQRQLDHLIIEVSTNDLIRHDSPDNQMSVSPTVQMEYWTSIFNLAKKMFGKIYVISALPKDYGSFPYCYDDVKIFYNEDDICDYNKRIENLCSLSKLPFIDLYNDLKQQDYVSTLHLDGVHPDTNGHIMIADLVYKKLKEHGI
jgi:lysophospholipase L1-like esterase